MVVDLRIDVGILNAKMVYLPLFRDSIVTKVKSFCFILSDIYHMNYEKCEWEFQK